MASVSVSSTSEAKDVFSHAPSCVRIHPPVVTSILAPEQQKEQKPGSIPAVLLSVVPQRFSETIRVGVTAFTPTI